MFRERKSIRLQGYDYAQEGMYFVTICTKEMECVFGEVVNGEMCLNDIGEMVDEEWRKTAVFRRDVRLDEYIVMPNHVHGVIEIVRGQNERGQADLRGQANGQPVRQFAGRKFGGGVSGSLSEIVGAFKSVVTGRVNSLRGTPGAPLWHRNYYEHVIRDKEDLERIRQYIRDNPRNWEHDQLHP